MVEKYESSSHFRSGSHSEIFSAINCIYSILGHHLINHLHTKNPEFSNSGLALSKYLLIKKSKKKKILYSFETENTIFA